MISRSNRLAYLDHELPPEPFDWNDAPDTRDTRPIHGSPTCAVYPPEGLPAGLADSQAVSRCGCGQTMIGAATRCEGCERAAHAPQGTQDRLFTPAPAPMPGQIMGRWDPYQ